MQELHSKEKTIKYGEKIEDCTNLGPFNRNVLWVFGCPFDCEGCIALGFRFGNHKEMNVSDAIEWYLNSEHPEGITISGGEPMQQAGALADMLEGIKKEKDAGVIVYTGYVYERLLEIIEKKEEGYIDIERFLGQIDILIDGPYMEKENDNQPYRGSGNQRIIALTDRYKGVIDEYYYNKTGRDVEIRLSEEGTLMVGVPGKDQVKIWSKVKKLGNTEE